MVSRVTERTLMADFTFSVSRLFPAQWDPKLGIHVT